MELQLDACYYLYNKESMVCIVMKLEIGSSKVENDVLNKVKSSENKNLKFLMQNDKLKMENKSLKMNH